MSSEEVAITTSAPQKLEGQALVDALKRQLEFYFSRENLENDAYLTSHMNAQKYVPVDVIANFRKVKSLTEDRELLVSVMRQCKNLAVDEEGRMVRPTLKMERKTLLLRDIPQSTPEDEIKSIFDEKCGKVVSIHSDVGDTWYVNFETEDDCLKTAEYLISKTFKGMPIRCRVKSENLLRGYYFHQGPPKDGTLDSSSWDDSVVLDEGFYDLSYPYGSQPYLAVNQWQVYPSSQGKPYEFNKGEHRGRDPMPRKDRKSSYGSRRKKGQYRKPRDGQQKGPRPLPQPQLGPEHFPALPSHKKTHAGYSKPFRKYSRERLAEIVDEVTRKGLSRPDSFPSSEECVVLKSSPTTKCFLLEPFPVMYPASPSPYLAAQPHHSSMPPLLYLNTFDGPGPVLLQDSLETIPEPQQEIISQISSERSFMIGSEPEVAKSQDEQKIQKNGLELHTSEQVLDTQEQKKSADKKPVASVVKAEPGKGKISKPKSDLHKPQPSGTQPKTSTQKPDVSVTTSSKPTLSHSSRQLTYAEMARRSTAISPPTQESPSKKIIPSSTARRV